MAQDKNFRCQACGAAFGSRQELDQHNKKAHPDMGRNPGSSPKDRSQGDL
jgi:uncharacterized C2H2 Zn-finger protein